MAAGTVSDMRPSTTALGVLPTGPDGVVGEVDVAEAVRRSVLGGPAAARLNLSVLDVSGLDGNAAADALARSVTAIAAAEVAQVELVAHWADLHDPDTRADLSGSDLPGEVLAGLERRVRPGGDGTPRVTEFAATELGVLLGVTTTTAQGLLRDVLDLRHRHPQLWTAVRAGRARFWQARQVTRMTHTAGLDRTAARHVDDRTAPHLGSVPWGRMLGLVEAAVIEADPEAAETRRLEKAMERFVRTGQSTEHGTSTLYARVEAGHAIVFFAICDRIAQILADLGDPDPIEVLRSKAIGWLGTPLRAAALLHQAENRAQAQAQAQANATMSADAADEASEPAATTEPSKPSEPSVPLSDSWSAPSEHTDNAPPPAASVRGYANAAEDGVLDIASRGASTPAVPPGCPPGSPPGSSPVGGRGHEDRRDNDEQESLRLRQGDLHPADNDADDRDHTCTCSEADGAESLHRLVIKPGVDLDAFLPASTLYVHMSLEQFHRHHRGAVRAEGLGPVTVEHAVELLLHTRVTVKPVIDLHQHWAVDGYQVPPRIREHTQLRYPVEVFPHGTLPARRADADHVLPYQPGKTAGQTSTTNTALLARGHHRVKTHGRGWIHRQPVPGIHYWRTPQGHWTRVDHHGTHTLGRHLDATDTTMLDEHPHASRHEHALATLILTQ